jgi:nucleoside-diphosphate-sugar epimerase
VRSKTLSEKELLSYDESSSSSSKEDDRSRALEVVTLACGLVGGDSIQTYLWGSYAAIVAPLTGQDASHNALLFLQALLGSVPLVHVEDVCEAHVFCMEQESMAGRFLCAAGYPNMRDIVDHFAAKHPDLKIQLTQYVHVLTVDRNVQCSRMHVSCVCFSVVTLLASSGEYGCIA